MLRLAGIHISRRRGIRVAMLLLSECTKTLSVADTTRLGGNPFGDAQWRDRQWAEKIG